MRTQENLSVVKNECIDLPELQSDRPPLIDIENRRNTPKDTQTMSHNDSSSDDIQLLPTVAKSSYECLQCCLAESEKSLQSADNKGHPIKPSIIGTVVVATVRKVFVLRRRNGKKAGVLRVSCIIPYKFSSKGNWGSTLRFINHLTASLRLFAFERIELRSDERPSCSLDRSKSRQKSAMCLTV